LKFLHCGASSIVLDHARRKFFAGHNPVPLTVFKSAASPGSVAKSRVSFETRLPEPCSDTLTRRYTQSRRYTLRAQL
jgi:hypothetical protein